MTSSAPQRRGSAVGDLLDSDFLGLHLESLLVRQPQTKTEQHVNHNSILASPFNSHRRGSKDATSSARNGNNTSRVRRTQQDTRSISASSRASSSILSPIDGVFESFFVPETISSTSSSGPSVQGRIGADGYDYFDRSIQSSHGSETPATPFSCTSISTSFGRKRLANKTRTLSASASSISSDLSFMSCRDLSFNSEALLGRRPSDGTDGTGITTPPTGSEGALLLEKEWLEETAKEGLSSEAEQQLEESSDQTTWARFKEGGIIEPPEAESQAPSAASWVKTSTIVPSAKSHSRYTCMISSRPKSTSPPRPLPERETGKLNESVQEAPKQINRVTLVAFGDDGRSFRFTDTVNEQCAALQSSYTNHFSSNSPSRVEFESRPSGLSSKEQSDAALFNQQQQQQTIRVSGRSRPAFPF